MPKRASHRNPVMPIAYEIHLVYLDQFDRGQVHPFEKCFGNTLPSLARPVSQWVKTVIEVILAAFRPSDVVQGHFPLTGITAIFHR